MSFGFVVITFMAAVNIARARLTVPESESTGRAQIDVLVLGMLLTLGLAAAVGAVGDPLLDWLRITPETFQIAAGVILVVPGIRWLARPEPPAEPRMGGLAAALVPVTFPILATPELTALVISFAVTEGLARMLGALATAFVGLAILGPVSTSGLIPRRLLVLSTRFLGAAALVMAAALVVDGIRDI